MEQTKNSHRLPGRREDGAATKQNILEAAGEVFAEKGVDGATGKEIAERAGTSSAAVNYYFGGIDGLYAEVLVEAHHRLMAYEFLKSVAEAPGSPKARLNLFIDRVVRTILEPTSSNWALRVLSREILHRSAAFPVLLEKEIRPKKRIITGFIGESLGVPPDHPAVSRCLLNIVAPFALLLVGSSKMVVQVVAPESCPARDGDIDALVEHFQRFVGGGLAAIAAEIGQEKAGAAGKTGS